MILGATINAVAILLGSSIGLLLKGRISERFSNSILRSIALCVFILGVSSGIHGDILVMVVSLTLGTLMGEAIGIDAKLNNLAQWVQTKLAKEDSKTNFAEGFVTATLLFCVGAMAVVGSIDAGLSSDYDVIITKATIDFVGSIVLASTLGYGVIFSAVMVFFYQGLIEFFAGHLQDVFTYELISHISAVGGVMILGLGVNIALGAKIVIANMLPSFLFVVLYYYLFM